MPTPTPTAIHTCERGPLCPLQDHDCPIDAYYTDPITITYGTGGELAPACLPCEKLARHGCGHESCERIIHEYGVCVACLTAPTEAT